MLRTLRLQEMLRFSAVVTIHTLASRFRQVYVQSAWSSS